MIRFLLLTLLFILVARAVWKLVDSILEGARGTASGSRGKVAAVKLVQDPVCGTYVPPRADLSIITAGTTHYFCSKRCANEYEVRLKAQGAKSRSDR